MSYHRDSQIELAYSVGDVLAPCLQSFQASLPSGRNRPGPLTL